MYLISHNRPINELLNPNFKDISREYREEFIDMAQIEVSLEELLANREKLVRLINASLTQNDKKFLLDFVANEPDWTLVRDSKIKDYPSVKWKIMNQKKMSGLKRDKYIDFIRAVLEG